MYQKLNFCLAGEIVVERKLRVWQWCSQNRIVARAQVGHIYNAAQHAKVSVRKHALLGGSGGKPPQGKFWNLGPPRSHLQCFQAK